MTAELVEVDSAPGNEEGLEVTRVEAAASPMVRVSTRRLLAMRLGRQSGRYFEVDRLDESLAGIKTAARRLSLGMIVGSLIVAGGYVVGARIRK